jgi:hypothetical protein
MLWAKVTGPEKPGVKVNVPVASRKKNLSRRPYSEKPCYADGLNPIDPPFLGENIAGAGTL